MGRVEPREAGLNPTADFIKMAILGFAEFNPGLKKPNSIFRFARYVLGFDRLNPTYDF